jgi:uncharacterized RDD family membrane protein YckC
MSDWYYELNGQQQGPVSVGHLQHWLQAGPVPGEVAAAMSVAMAAFAVAWIVIMVITWLYYAKLQSGPRGATYGKRLMGLRVVTVDGRPLSFLNATGRYFAKFISGMIPFAIGFLMAAFTEKKQALHDMIAGTVVVKE